MKGFILLSRKLDKTAPIWSKPASWLKIWLFLLLHVRFTDGKYKRGENFFNYKTIAKECGVSEFVVKRCVHALVSALSLSTRRVPNGIIIKVLNYDKYQLPEKNNSCTKKLNSPRPAPITRLSNKRMNGVIKGGCKGEGKEWGKLLSREDKIAECKAGRWLDENEKYYRDSNENIFKLDSEGQKIYIHKYQQQT